MARLFFELFSKTALAVALVCASTIPAFGIMKPAKEKKPRAEDQRPQFRAVIPDPPVPARHRATVNLRDETDNAPPPLPPSQFNPDPGGAPPPTTEPIRLFPSEPIL